MNKAILKALNILYRVSYFFELRLIEGMIIFMAVGLLFYLAIFSYLISSSLFHLIFLLECVLITRLLMYIVYERPLRAKIKELKRKLEHREYLFDKCQEECMILDKKRR